MSFIQPIRSVENFILLGGDLFDVNSPNVGTMTRSVDLLTKYCTSGCTSGSKKQNFELKSPAAESFSHNGTCVDDIGKLITYNRHPPP